MPDKLSQTEPSVPISNRTIWYMVGDVTDAKAEPFVLMSVDTSVRHDGGVEGTVVSLHWTRDEAQRIADAFNEREAAGAALI